MPRSAPYLRGLRYSLATLAGLLTAAAFTLGNVVDHGMGFCDGSDGFTFEHIHGWPFTAYYRWEHHPGPSGNLGVRILEESFNLLRTALNLLIAVGASVAWARAVLWATRIQFSLRVLLGFVSVVGLMIAAVPFLLHEPIFWPLELGWLPEWLALPLFVGLLGAIFVLGQLVVRFICRCASIRSSPSIAHG